MKQYIARNRSDLRDVTVAGSLGQSAPAAGVLTLLYRAPGRATGTVVVTNRGGADTFRIAVAPLGAADTLAHYLAYDHPIEANDSLSTAGIELATGDAVRCYSTAGNLSFTFNGSEE